MALHVGFLLVWVCWRLSAGGHLLPEDDPLPTEDTMIYYPEIRDGKCFFPFYYKNRVFYDCIKFTAKHKWCSLNETFNGYWKYCSEEDLAKCVFPFWYRRMIYWECTDDSDGFGKKWCSLTQDYNKEKIWKYCDSW